MYLWSSYANKASYSVSSVLQKYCFFGSLCIEPKEKREQEHLPQNHGSKQVSLVE